MDAGIRHIEFLDAEIAAVERLIAQQALTWPEIRRLMTVPGVNLICMMGSNAIQHADAKLLRSVVEVGRDASVGDVVWLLRGEWRPRVMGAWYSLLHDSEAVTRAVLQSLATSSGSLTAPPLAVAGSALAEYVLVARKKDCSRSGCCPRLGFGGARQRGDRTSG